MTCDPWHKTHGSRSFNEWFNTGCMEAPIAGSTATVGTYSSKGVYTPPAPAALYSTGTGTFAHKVEYFNPGDTNFDTALFKNFPIHETLTMQFRVETYNTFNHPEFNGINNTATFADANSQDLTLNPQTASTFGQIDSATNSRVMQLALRLDF